MLPIDFENRMKEQLNDSEAFLGSYEKPYIKSLRINTGKNPDNIFPGFQEKYAVSVDKARVKWERKGLYYYEEGDEPVEDFLRIDSPGKSSLHAAGAYYIQEASAMIPVTKLDLNHSGLKVLDLCAAPGGKTTQIADYMGGEGLLVANEIISSRARILSENIERMGVRNALVINEDPHKAASFFPHFFDRILVDAPCSGEGMFRKHNEAMNEWSLENVKICADRQDDILDCAVNMLAVGGRIVYSTCTFSPEEDEECINRFLERYPQFERVCEDERIYPHQDRGEGHFAAVLSYKRDILNGMPQNSTVLEAKPSIEEFEGKEKKKNKKTRKTCGKQDGAGNIKIFYDFCKKYIKECDFLGINEESIEKGDFPENIKSRMFIFGERLFLAPVSMPSLNGLSVLRPGLALGKIIKDRFEPDHALALALNRNQVIYSADYEYDSSEINVFLRGGTLSCSGENGWYLICTQGLSLGWGKCSNGCIKNHYPKGLRIQG